MIIPKNTWTIVRIVLTVFLLTSVFRLAGGREWLQALANNAPQVGQASLIRVVNALVCAGLLVAALTPLIVFFFVDHSLRRQWNATQARLSEVKQNRAWRARELAHLEEQIARQWAQLYQLHQQQAGREAIR